MNTNTLACRILVQHLELRQREIESNFSTPRLTDWWSHSRCNLKNQENVQITYELKNILSAILDPDHARSWTVATKDQPLTRHNFTRLIVPKYPLPAFKIDEEALQRDIERAKIYQILKRQLRNGTF